LDRNHFFFMINRDADCGHLFLQGRNNLGVDKFQQARSLVD